MKIIHPVKDLSTDLSIGRPLCRNNLKDQQNEIHSKYFLNFCEVCLRAQFSGVAYFRLLYDIKH